MLRLLVIGFLITFYQIESVTIEYPSSKHIVERIRKDLDSIDQKFRYYIVPREIQYHANALQGQLEYLLKCEGSKNSISLTIPSSAADHLNLVKDSNSNAITAKLKDEKLTSELVGRYTCSETIDDKKHETSVYVFIQDGSSVFTKKLYPKVLQQTGVHFFNIPCQTTSWFPRLSCPPTDSEQCQKRECSDKERQINELKCNTPVCTGQDICIPVYFEPSITESNSLKSFFDPQIGFALENPTIPNSVTEFFCMSDYTPNQLATVPYGSFTPEYIIIHQSSLNIMPDETVRLSCEIQYGTKVGQKLPNIFWFEDIYDLTLMGNETEKAVFNQRTQTYSKNSSITLRGFKQNKTYRFYCVRVSEQGIYSRSVDITSDNSSSLDLDVTSSGSATNNQVLYGSDSSYDITIFTVPRSKILIEIIRNDVLLTNDKRFELLLIGDNNNQYYEYTLTIYNVTFEDETDIKIIAKSSVLEKTKIIKPNVIGDPVGQFAFIPDQIPRSIPWRDEISKKEINIYSYGIFVKESYRVVCTVRHRADIERPIKVFIQHAQCPLDNCLSTTIYKACHSPSDRRLSLIEPIRINNFQTQFVSSDREIVEDPLTGHQYICCYEQNNVIVLAKALTTLANNREMFSVQKPEFTLVTGDVLTYKCTAHDLIYVNLRMIYNDGLFTYERNSFDSAWRLIGTNQQKQPDIEWLPQTNGDEIRDTSIVVKTSTLKKIGNNGYLLCTGFSKRSDIIPNLNDTYMINVDDPIPLKFKNNLQSVIKIDRKSGTDVQFDCSYNGRPQPKIVWFKGKSPVTLDNSTLQLLDNNGSIHITRAQPTDTGYYTCELFNGRDPTIRRSFDLRVKNPYLSAKYRRLTTILIIISTFLIVILLILLIIVAIKYHKMKILVSESIFHRQQPTGNENTTEPPLPQLTRIRLPDNFASTQQVRTLLSFVNGDTLPAHKEEFKELGRGQFGVVYQVRLPELGLVAAKLLPQSIRNIEHRRDKRKKNDNTEESQEMLAKTHKIQKEKAAEMLIDEIKVMYKAGKHVNIVSLLKVAYPETKLRYVLRGGPIRDEDSFYLMELCSNGSLESMLKNFLQSSTDSPDSKLSLYETLSKQKQRGMAITEAQNLCILTEDDLKLVAYQVACGVDYLNRRLIAHCDIAARNVLVTSRFVMKICDFGLAAWTTYKTHREKVERHETVQLEKKSNDVATHNLTPELAQVFLRASTPDERILLNRPSIKSDVWSFGIFLWTLFLKCRIRPFNKLLEETKKQSNGESFFRRLAHVISEGRVLRYIDYQPEIPREIYAIIRECLLEENDRPEMIRIRALLCHSKMLSKQAFEYYRSEYNRYEEDNATDDVVVGFDGHQGVDLPSFQGENNPDDNRTPINSRRNDGVTFRSKPNDDDYPAASDYTSDTYLSQSENDYSQQKHDSYLTPAPTDNQQRTIVRDASNTNSPITTNQTNIPQNDVKNIGALRPAPKPPSPKHNYSSDSYV